MGKKRDATHVKKKLAENKVSGVGDRKKLMKEYIALRKKELGIK